MVSSAEDCCHCCHRTYLDEVSKPEGSLKAAVTPSLASHRQAISNAKRLLGEVMFTSHYMFQ